MYGRAYRRQDRLLGRGRVMGTLLSIDTSLKLLLNRAVGLVVRLVRSLRDGSFGTLGGAI